MDKNKLKKEMLEAIFIKTGGRIENPQIAEICAEIAVKNCYISAVSGQLKCHCKNAKFTRAVDADFNPLCGRCGKAL